MASKPISKSELLKEGKTDAVQNFRDEYSFLSNFFKHPLTIEGIMYPTVEHAFQAAKCMDKETKQRLADMKSPIAVKRSGRKVKLREDWESVKLDIMLECLRTKFATGSELCRQLLATGDRDLVEGNTWHDDFWGDCFCKKHTDKRGKNHLGRLIMKVRDERRQQLHVGG